MNVGDIISSEIRRALDAKHVVKVQGETVKVRTFAFTPGEQVETEKLIKKHAQAANRLDRLRKHASAQKYSANQDKFLASYKTRFCACIRSLAKQKRYVSLADLDAMAAALDVWKPLSEPVRVFTRAKQGGFRPIVLYGSQRMAQQFMVRDLLQCAGIDNEHDYTRRGSGGERALIAEITRRLSGGYRYWHSADIKECFASLKPGHFGWLPISAKLLRNVVFLPKCAIIRVALTPDILKNTQSEITESSQGNFSSLQSTIKMVRKRVRQELPQGAVLSPLIARAFVGRELRASLGNKQAVAVSYLDNLILGARQKPNVELALGSLRQRLLSLPAGPILLHTDRTRDIHEKYVEALGYKISPEKGRYHVRPGHKRFDRFHHKLLVRWEEEHRPDDIEEFAEQRVDLWMPSQQAWTRIPYYSRDLVWSRATVEIGEYGYMLRNKHRKVKLAAEANAL